jgi:hypothetical protein
MPAASTMSSSGTLLLVAAGTGGLLVYDISNPSTPAILSQYLPNGGVAVWDALAPATGLAILAADADGLIILNLANPSNPQLLSQTELPFLNPFPSVNNFAGILTAFTLAYQKGLAYVGAGDEAIIFAYDISVPSAARLMAMNVISPFGLDLVPAITPVMSNLYTDVGDGAGESEVVQLDITIPQNSIELYFPPAALFERRSHHPRFVKSEDSKGRHFGDGKTTIQEPQSRRDEVALAPTSPLVARMIVDKS